jgi:hypothetical protein
LLLFIMLVQDIFWSSASGQVPFSLRQVGQLGGLARAVAIQDNIAYVGVGPRLFTIDISDPAQPNMLGSSTALSHVVQHVAVMGDYAYVSDGSGQIKVISIASPNSPHFIGHLDIPGEAADMVVDNNLLLMANGSVGGLQIANIADPARPVLIGSHDTPGSANSLAVAGDLVYLGDGFSGMQVFNVSNPGAPVLVGACCSSSTPIVGLDLSGDLIYAVDGTTLTMIDVRDPTEPYVRDRLFTAGEDRTVTARGAFAYVGIGAEFNSAEGGVRVIDCSDPDNLVEIGHVPTAGRPSDLALADDQLLLADGSGGLRILSFHTTPIPAEIGSFDQSWWGAIVKANRDIVHVVDQQTLHVVGASNLARPEALGSISLAHTISGMANSGNMVYAAAGPSGLQIIDARNPVTPTLAGALVPPAVWSASDVAVRGPTAYLVDETAGLRAIDVSDPTAPQQVGFLPRLWVSGPIALAEQGNRGYVLDLNDGIWILDLSDPATPRTSGFFTTRDFIGDIAGSENRLYTVSRNHGLIIYDTTDPSQVRQLGALSIDEARRIELMDSIAYVAAGSNGVFVVDVSNPAAPVLLGHADTPGSSFDIAIAGAAIYVADMDGGLVVLTSGRTERFFPLIVRRD